MIYTAIVVDPSGLFKKLDDGTLAIQGYQAYQKALEIEPGNKEVLKEMEPAGNLYAALANTSLGFFNKGQALTKEQKTEEANKQYEESIKNAELASKVNPKDTLTPYLCLVSGSIIKNHEVFEKASEFMIAHPDTKDKAAYCLYLAGHYYNNKKDPKKALEIAQKGTKFGANDDLQKLIVQLLEQGGNPEEAINAIKESLKNNPNDANQYFNMGVLYERIKKYDEAIAAYEKAISINNYPDAIYNAGVLYYNKGFNINQALSNMSMEDYNKYKKVEEEKISVEFKKALPFFEKLYLQDPKNAKNLDILSQIYTQLKMKDKADKIKKERDALGD